MTNEGLSGASSCICKFYSRVACFCIEDDEEFAGDHLGFPALCNLCWKDDRCVS